MVTYIPNEQSNQKVYAGFETTPGTAVTPDFRLLGTFTASKSAALSRSPEVTGGYDRLVTPKRSPATFSGSYNESPLTFVTLPQLMRAGLRAGDTGVLVGGSTGAYQYAKAPSFDTDDVETMTVQEGVDGLGFQATGVRFPDWNISIDADNTDGAWVFSAGNAFMTGYGDLPGSVEITATGGSTTDITMTGAGWTVDDHVGKYVFRDPDSHDGEVRQVLTNTTDTLTVSTAFSTAVSAGDTFTLEPEFPDGIALPTYEAIPSYGTRVYLDPASGTIGTSQVTGRVISTNVSVSQTITTKRFLENSMDEISARTGKGPREVTGQIRLEFDRRTELNQLRNLDEFALRIEQDGTEIDSGVTRRARIDVPRAVWDDYTRDSRQENLTVTLGWVAYLPDVADIITVDAINDLATLP